MDNMKWVGTMCAAMGLSLAGCQASPADGHELLAVAANNLAITELDVEHGSVNGERVLTVRGFDDDGATIATATLRTGMVLYGADMPETWNAGTELTIAAGEATVSLVSPDRFAHEDALPRNAALASFVQLDGVASAIEAEAGIRFARPEAAYQYYTTSDCNSAQFPTNQFAGNMCCAISGSVSQRIVNSVHLIPGGTNDLKLGFRSYDVPCRTSSGATGCTSNCYYGPCGARVDQVLGTAHTLSLVFHPRDGSDSYQCGYDDQVGDYNPSPWNGEAFYPDAGQSCTCTGCASDGTPTPAGCNYEYPLLPGGGGAQ